MDGSDVKSEVFEDELVWIDDEDPLLTRDTEVGGKEVILKWVVRREWEM